jgi:GT2 family glycosyltransferase
MFHSWQALESDCKESMLYILTLTWNACDKLSKLKNSLIPALSDVDYTWLIKDNASKDETIKVASDWGDRTRVIPYKNNLQNFSAGMNHLFHVASPQDNDLVMLLNNDVIFNDTSSIKNMLNIINHDESVGAVGARLLYTGTDKLQHAGVVFHNQMATPTHFRVNEKTDKNAEKNREFQVVTGAVLVTKAEYFKNAWTGNKSGTNGMDENYHWAFDDVDLCLSIKYNMEKRIVYCGQTNVFHEESATLKKNPANKLFSLHNVNYLKNKWAKRYSLDQDIYTKDSKYNIYQE